MNERPDKLRKIAEMNLSCDTLSTSTRRLTATRRLTPTLRLIESRRVTETRRTMVARPDSVPRRLTAARRVTAARRTGKARRAEEARTADLLLHELQVHQIELQMQNDALRQSQLELEMSRDHYKDFYDFSPVGYITLSDKGLISEVNLTGAAMLGVERARLRQQRFAAFIAKDQRDQWYKIFMGAIAHDEPLTCELPLHNPNGEHIFAQLVCLRLSKPGAPPVLRIVLTDISNRIRDEEAIRQLAFYDALTHLPNRRLFNDRLDQAMAASKRSGKYAALMFIYLDNFKPLNDRYGHSMGDLLLLKVAHRISSCMREMDTVSRFGGDEFVVLLSELNADLAISSSEASGVADKIRTALAQPYHLTIPRNGNTEVRAEHHCTSSIGVILFFSHEVSREDILRYADMAMYQAKDEGRNRVCFFDPARIDEWADDKRLTTSTIEQHE